MKSFDEWWEENYMMLSAYRTEAEDIYNIGAQSRQSEVDELKKRIDAAIKEIQDESWSDEYGDNQAPTFKLIKILKGAVDET